MISDFAYIVKIQLKTSTLYFCQIFIFSLFYSRKGFAICKPDLQRWMSGSFCQSGTLSLTVVMSYFFHLQINEYVMKPRRNIIHLLTVGPKYRTYLSDCGT